MYKYFAYMYVCASRVPGTQGSYKRALHALELELKVVVNSHVSARN